MAGNLPFLLVIGLILGITLSSCGTDATAQVEVTEPEITISNATVVNDAGKTKRTCACEDTDSPICASNGITYKNSCRFDCAKARVNRLRMIKKGQCTQSAGTGSYWNNRKSPFNF